MKKQQMQQSKKNWIFRSLLETPIKSKVLQLQYQKAQRVLIQKAYTKFGNIQPCGKAKDFSESFTKHSGILVFWFNTEDGSTHVMQSTYQQCVYDSN